MGKLTDKIRARLDFSKKNGMTMTGQPANEIEILSLGKDQFKEEAEQAKKMVFTFGRFNPPTTGHQKLLNAVKKHAEQNGAEHIVYASHSNDPQKNPLPHDEKIGFMKKMFPDTNIYDHSDVKNVLHAAKHLETHGYKHATLVVGDDRVKEFKDLLGKYNKSPDAPDYDETKHFHIPNLQVVSAGHRDPDAEGVEGMSASKLRSHVQSGNFNEFKKGVPKPQHAKDMYSALRNRMGVNEEMSPSAVANKQREDAEQRRRELEKEKQDDITAANKEDDQGRMIAKKSKTLTTEMKARFLNPMERDQMAPGPKPVDIGMDKDLESKDTGNQLKRRQQLKKFSAMVEEIGVAATSKPSPIFSPMPAAQVKPRPKKVEEDTVDEAKGDFHYQEWPGQKPKKAFNLDKYLANSEKRMAAAKKKDAAKKVSEDTELEEKRGLWDNIHAKRKRIKAGSGERMRKPGSEGAPTNQDFKNAQEEVDYIEERGADSKGLYRSTESGAGLTKKGVAHFRRKNPGSKLQTAVTEKNPKGKRASRRKSFCARMGGMPGPMKDEKGRPTRKAMSLRRWRC